MLFADFSQRLRKSAAADMTLTGLRAAIIAVALVFIVASLLVRNKWVLAGMLAYLVLP